jgi:hypothetical protein
LTLFFLAPGEPEHARLMLQLRREVKADCAAHNVNAIHLTIGPVNLRGIWLHKSVQGALTQPQVDSGMVWGLLPSRVGAVAVAQPQ